MTNEERAQLKERLSRIERELDGRLDELCAECGAWAPWADEDTDLCEKCLATLGDQQ